MKNLKKKSIAFFTQTDDFNEHIMFLKKKSVNVYKINEFSEIEDLSFIVIDLIYEDDKAYDFLNKINNSPNLSQLNVFVVVRTKQEMGKLSILQNIRIIDYLSSQVTPEEFEAKVISALDFEKQPFRRVDRKIKLRVDAEITHISESGALINSSILFNSKQVIEIQSKLIETAFSHGDPIYNVAKTIVGVNGIFISEIDFLSLDDEDRLRLRQLIYDWRAL